MVGAPYATLQGNSAQGAAYIFSRNRGGADAWGQVARLSSADGAAYDYFGISASVNYGLAIVGAHGAGVGGRDWQGAVYVFYRNRGGADAWGQVARLTSADGAALDRLGWSVSISGDTVALGAPYADAAGHSAQGAAYLFRRNQAGAPAWGTSTSSQ